VIRQLVLTPAARADLASIWDHTAGIWGQAQARAYLTGLDRLFSLLADQPEIARERPEISPPVRLHPWRSHLVIFRATSDRLEVLRIAHARSEWSEFLSE
jgi:toxin ParE1/3/4